MQCTMQNAETVYGLSVTHSPTAFFPGYWLEKVGALMERDYETPRNHQFES